MLKQKAEGKSVGKFGREKENQSLCWRINKIV